MRIFFSINSTTNKSAISDTPFLINVTLNHSSVIEFEVDKGASLSTLRERDATHLGVKIHPTSEKVLAYGGNKIKLIDCFKDKIHDLSLFEDCIMYKN